jgi:hypothetical protein
MNDQPGVCSLHYDHGWLAWTCGYRFRTLVANIFVANAPMVSVSERRALKAIFVDGRVIWATSVNVTAAGTNFRGSAKVGVRIALCRCIRKGFFVVINDWASGSIRLSRDRVQFWSCHRTGLACGRMPYRCRLGFGCWCVILLVRRCVSRSRHQLIGVLSFALLVCRWTSWGGLKALFGSTIALSGVIWGCIFVGG